MGGYSVKTGYLLAIGYYSSPLHTSTTLEEDWKSLVWKPNIPPKVKIFMWRAVMDFLPTMVNLREHHVPTSGLCDNCGKDWGSTMHTIFFCSLTKEFWKGSIYWLTLKSNKSAPFLEVCQKLHSKLKMEDYEVWIIAMWSVWQFICGVKHNKTIPSKLEVGIDYARGFLEAFHTARREFPHRMNIGVKEGIKKWFPMKIGKFRLDVDAAYNINTNSFGVGAAVRNSEGQLCAALAKPVARSSSVLEAELIGILYGLGLCLQEDLGPVVLFSDSILAVRLLHELFEDPHDTPLLLSRDYPELVELVEGGFVLDICHMYREANFVAHNLARYGASCSDMCTWTSNYPPWLTSLVNQDYQ